MRRSYKKGRYEISHGEDHVLGKFIQIFDPEFEDETGEGLVFDADEMFGISVNYIGLPPNEGSFENAMDIFTYWINRLENEN